MLQQLCGRDLSKLLFVFWRPRKDLKEKLLLVWVLAQGRSSVGKGSWKAVWMGVTMEGRLHEPWRGKPGEEKKPNPMDFRQTDFNKLGNCQKTEGLERVSSSPKKQCWRQKFRCRKKTRNEKHWLLFIDLQDNNEPQEEETKPDVQRWVWTQPCKTRSGNLKFN